MRATVERHEPRVAERGGIVGQRLMWAVDLDAMLPFADMLPAVGRYCPNGAAVYGEAVRLFVWHDNRRQRLINANPAYRSALPLLF